MKQATPDQIKRKLYQAIREDCARYATDLSTPFIPVRIFSLIDDAIEAANKEASNEQAH